MTKTIINSSIITIRASFWCAEITVVSSLLPLFDIIIAQKKSIWTVQLFLHLDCFIWRKKTATTTTTTALMMMMMNQIVHCIATCNMHLILQLQWRLAWTFKWMHCVFAAFSFSSFRSIIFICRHTSHVANCTFAPMQFDQDQASQPIPAHPIPFGIGLLP